MLPFRMVLAPTARWLLPIVLLALALLPGSAQSQHFLEAARWEDPLRRPIMLVFGIGGFAFGDVDSDGDRDLCFGSGIEGFSCAERTELGFDWPRVLIPGTNQGSYFSGVAALDVDGDGDDDFIHGGSFGDSGRYIAQVSPGVVESRSDARFADFSSEPPSSIVNAKPATGDLNGDGMVDVLVGWSPGWHSDTHLLSFIEQVAPGTFVTHTGTANPFDSVTFSGDSGTVPVMTDHDGDGDLDVLVIRTSSSPSDDDQRYWYFEQVAPGDFVERTGEDNPLAWLEATGELPLAAAFEDVDGDGDSDLLLAGGGTPSLAFYERDGDGYVRNWGPYSVVGGFRFNRLAWPSFGDVDGDGDSDVAVSLNDHNTGRIAYLTRTDLLDAPFWNRGFSEGNPFREVSFAYPIAPALGDVDGDGDVDLVIGSGDGSARPLAYYEQTEAGVFQPRTGGANPFEGLDAGPHPALGDVDGDGDLDLVTQGNNIWGSPDRFLYFEQTEVGAFEQQTGAASPLEGLSTYYCADVRFTAVPVLGDLDLDGDLDLVSGRCFFQNRGGTFFPVFAGNPFTDMPACSGYGLPSCHVAALTDLNGDGNLDAVEGTGFPQDAFRTFFNSGLPVASEPSPPESAGQLILSGPSPNPASGTARLTLMVSRAQHVRVTLYDALGRRLAVLHDGAVPATAPTTLEVNTSALSPGVYVIEARAGRWGAATRLVVL